MALTHAAGSLKNHSRIAFILNNLSRGGVLAFALAALAVSLLAVRPAAQGRSGGANRSETDINQSSDPLLQSFRFRSIGPASMGGRIDDIAVAETDPNIIYVGYAVGGVFKSENNGVSFRPVFETYNTASIGDIAIHPRDPNIVYVGTGEPLEFPPVMKFVPVIVTVLPPAVGPEAGEMKVIVGVLGVLP